MISVSEARRIVVSRVQPLPAETVPLSTAGDRVLAQDVVARLSRPPVAISSMDGYAVCAVDVTSVPVHLRLAGVAAAGHGFADAVQPGEAVRIFTGVPLPNGADSVVIQEHTRLEGDVVVILEAPPPGRWIRPTAADFSLGEPLLRAGKRLSARDLALAAGANVTTVAVRQRPRVAFFATGDELVLPGAWQRPEQTINSNGVYLAAQLERMGALARDLGMVGDDAAAITQSLDVASDSDLILTIGGASVGDRDLVRPVLADLPFERGFERVAMRPGKPSAFGWLRGTPVLVLPGNPVSAVVTTLRLAKPIIDGLLGLTGDDSDECEAILGSPLGGNDEREDYLRARLSRSAGAALEVTPFARQDSALSTLLAAADCLIVRPAHAAAARRGDIVPIIRL